MSWAFQRWCLRTQCYQETFTSLLGGSAHIFVSNLPPHIRNTDKASVPAGLDAKPCKLGFLRTPPLRSHPRALSSTCIFFAIYCSAFISTELYTSSLPPTPPCCRPRSAPPFWHCYSARALSLPVSFLSQIKGFVHLSLMKFLSPFLT